MDPELATILNRIGLILGFFSFWFAAPEILGEERLKGCAVNSLGGCLGILFLFTISGIILAVQYMAFHPTDNPYILGFVAIFFTLFMFWLLPQKIMPRVPFLIEKISLRFIGNPRRRKRLLYIGAILFVLGFVLQFAATF
jgi:hypothetical protein